MLGDRVLGVRLADTEAPDEEWTPKAGMLVLMNTPGLARLRVEFDDTVGRLRIGLPGGVNGRSGRGIRR